MDEYQSLVQGSPVGLYDLTCAYRTNPLGIDEKYPRLSWKMAANRRGARQMAYRIRAARKPEDLTSNNNLIWDSGKVESDQSTHVSYAGESLPSRQRVWWSVQVWDDAGTVLSSDPAWWEMGLLDRSDWSAAWVGASLVGGPRTSVPPPFLRQEFRLDAPVQSARLYVTALGLHECYLNGQRVSDDVFAPGWTDYHQRVQYQVYDVTRLLHDGENSIGAILGDGWYCGHVAWKGRQLYGDRPRLLAQLEIRHTDGSETRIVSDEKWHFAVGPILESDFLMGESYDARRELSGWNLPGYPVDSWSPVTVFLSQEANLVAQRGPAVRRIQELQPVADPVRLGNKWIFDLGQNMVGWVRLKVKGQRGTTVTLRFAEVLNPDGTLYTTNLRSARSTDVYTLKGESEETYEPRFTFHGFRYVEISGLPGTLKQDTVTGIVLHSDMAVTGSFECSDPLINQLQHNIQWGQRGNFVDVPTDCPQRDERLGWTGDAQVFIRTAAYNMNVAAFFTKWVQDMADAQSELGQIPPVVPNVLGQTDRDGGPAWADAFAICPWTIYLCFGDRDMLAQHYPNIKRYVDHLAEMSLNHIRCHPDGEFKNGDWDGYGDWLSINAETPKDLIGTAFMAYSAALVARMAGVLGFAEDQDRYTRMVEATRQAFQRRFVTADGLVAGHSQTAYVLALHFDLLPEALRPAAVRELVRGIHSRGDHLSTGFVGAPYLMHVLTRAGRNDIAYQLLNQKSWPSWLYSVTQGATTIWERWDGWTHDKGFQDPGMNSFNHYAYGSIGDWLYSVVAGIDIDPQQPGYRHILLKPQPGGGLSYARASLETPYGPLFSGWQVEGDAFLWDVVIPPNTQATLTFPVAANTVLVEGTRPISQAEGLILVEGEGGPVFQVASGSYRFRMPRDTVPGLLE